MVLTTRSTKRPHWATVRTSPRLPALRGVLILSAFLHAERIEAQDRTQAVVVVTVLETPSLVPLPEVSLQLAGLPMTLRTDSSGSVYFRDVPSGNRSLEGRRLGYARASATVKVDGSDTTHVILFMRAISARLPAVWVREKATPIALREFEQRRQRGTGRYITQDQIDAAFGSDLNSLLASRLGLRADKVAYNRRGPSGRCNLTAYLDGVHIQDNSVTDIDPAQLAGVEYYTGPYVPVQYRMNVGCGVILFWSKS